MSRQLTSLSISGPIKKLILTSSLFKLRASIVCQAGEGKFSSGIVHAVPTVRFEITIH
jgi:hypothetical protein